MFSLSADQELFEKTTARFLDAYCPLSQAGALATHRSRVDAARWQQGAELGWISPLVPEACGGGSVSDNGMMDLSVIALQFGRHAAPGPLVATNVVAAALGRWGSPQQRATPLAELTTGAATAAWCPTMPVDPWAATAHHVTVDCLTSDSGILNGTTECVQGAQDATYLLISALHAEGGGPGSAPRSYYLVDTSTPGVQTTALDGLDPTRRCGRVSLHDVAVPASCRVGIPGQAETGDGWLTDIVATLHAAEIVGAVQSAVEMTLDWVQQRYSFGRPLASYQEIKHRMADVRTTLEACAAITARAARALGNSAADASALASAAIAYVGAHGPEIIHDCMQLHGGIGVTAESGLHLLLRRAVVDANIAGTPADFTQRLVGLLDAATDEEHTG